MEQLRIAEEFVTKLVRWRVAQTDLYEVSRGPERVLEVSDLRRNLRSLGIKDLDYFDEGLDCIQYAQASRGAIVLAWTGLVDLLQAKIGRDGYVSLNAILNTAFRGIHKKLVRYVRVRIWLNTSMMPCF
jgi:hypothetical protein